MFVGGICALSITALMFIAAGPSLLRDRFGLSGLAALVFQASPVIATSTMQFQIIKPHDNLKDQAVFTQRDAGRGWLATTTKWKAVYNPFVSDSIVLYDLLKDPEARVNVAAANPKIVKAFSSAYLPWKISSTDFKLAIKDVSADVKTDGDTFQFPATTSGAYGQVIYTKVSTPVMSENDITFVAHIKSTDRDRQVRRIAFQVRSWIFQINANNNLELVLYEAGKATSTTVVGTKVVIKQGVDYDVSFNMEGMTYLRDYVRINVREHGSEHFVDAGSGLGVLQVRSTEYRLRLGMSLERTNPFVGSIGNVRMFEAQITRPELESFYPKTQFSCQVGTVTLRSGSSTNFFSQAGTMRTATSTTADLCANHQQNRTCTDGKVNGDNAYHFASCADMSSLPGVTLGGPGVVSLKDGSILAMKQNPNRVSKTDSTGTTYTVSVFKSTDAAKTWTFYSTLLSTSTVHGGAYFAGNMFTLQLKSGRLVTAYRLHANTDGVPLKSAAWDIYELRTKISDDNGKTWREGGVIDTRSGAGRFGTWEPTLIQPSKRPGILQAYFASERPASLTCPGVGSIAQDIVMKESKDEGVTWEPVARIAVRRGVSREGVPGVTELRDGSMLLAFETFIDSSCTSREPFIWPGIAHSNDSGLTWQYVPTVKVFNADGVRAGWPHLRTLADGRVLLKVATNQDRLDTTNDPQWISKSDRDVKLLVSKNIPTYAQPPVWSDTPVLALYGAQWGDMAQLSDGSVIAVGNDYDWKTTKIRVVPLSELK